MDKVRFEYVLKEFDRVEKNQSKEKEEAKEVIMTLLKLKKCLGQDYILSFIHQYFANFQTGPDHALTRRCLRELQKEYKIDLVPVEGVDPKDKDFIFMAHRHCWRLVTT